MNWAMSATLSLSLKLRRVSLPRSAKRRHFEKQGAYPAGFRRVSDSTYGLIYRLVVLFNKTGTSSRETNARSVWKLPLQTYSRRS